MQRGDYYASEFAKVVELLAQGERATAVREAGRLFEELLKDVLLEFLPRLPFVARRAVFEAEQQLGEGKRGIAELQLGSLIGVMKTAQVLDAIGEVTGKPVRTLTKVDLNLVRDLRNDAVHNAVVPESHDADYVVSGLRTYLSFFDVKLASSHRSPVRSIADVSHLLEERFVSAEAIEGTVAFYRRLAEIARRPEIDRFDVTYLVDHPPQMAAARPIREYWDVVRDKVLSGHARMRRIVTINNEAKAAWILFNLVASHSRELDENFVIAHFDAIRSGRRGEILLPNLALYYSSADLTDGFAWIYSHDMEDHQNFVCLSGKALFATMRHIYAGWFKSCDRLDAERATRLFRRTFGPVGASEVGDIARRLRDAIGLDEPALEPAIGYWVRQLERFPADE